jgi:hypothetical protein
MSSSNQTDLFGAPGITSDGVQGEGRMKCGWCREPMEAGELELATPTCTLCRMSKRRRLMAYLRLLKEATSGNR